MKLCKTYVVRVCLFLLAAFPAYCQRGNIGVDLGATSDTFGGFPTNTSPVVDINGEFAILQYKPKTGRPAIVAGGELRFPGNAANDHAKEYAAYGGIHWKFLSGNLTVGIDGQFRKIYLPVAFVDNQFFARDRMELLETPIVLRYKFGPDKKFFAEAKGFPEYSPRWRPSGAALELPNPKFDHGYFVQGSVGYNFGSWYVKGTYENRYFSFIQNPNNPSNLYNWRTNYVAAGAGFIF
jgi:hypothetical protein